MEYAPSNVFFQDRIKHPTRAIQILFLSIIDQGAKKPPYQQMQAAKFIAAYEQYVKKQAWTADQQPFDEEEEQTFLERILTVFLKTETRFDTDFDFAKRGLTKGQTDTYALTRSKFQKVKISIEGPLIDPILTRGLTSSQLEDITNRQYLTLYQYV
jgi:hypothetical protein